MRKGLSGLLVEKFNFRFNRETPNGWNDVGKNTHDLTTIQRRCFCLTSIDLLYFAFPSVVRTKSEKLKTMRDTSAYCRCCGKREQVGQCVKGSVMCACETDDDFYSHDALECPDCKKCPVHCKCEKCDCPQVGWGIGLQHRTDCRVRQKCRYKIRYDNAKREMESAERILKSFDIQRTSESATKTIRTTEGNREEI